MTLLICVFAAIIATVKWYKDAPEGSMKLGTISNSESASHSASMASSDSPG